MTPSHIGIIGLAAMGAHLARNFADKHIHTALYNRTAEKTRTLLKEHGNEYLHGTYSLKGFVATLSRPRVMILMVKSGEAIDKVLAQLLPHLSPNDIIMDCGNSHYRDTERRIKELAAHKIHLIGCGISGGEEGALHGPSLMPGGNHKAASRILPLLEKVAAKDFQGHPCATWIGPGGSGHFVKTVHNGIEYGIMQLIAESYHLLEHTGYTHEQIADFFESLNRTQYMHAFLLEITTKIFRKKEGKKYMIDLIKDEAAQKGTGKWTTEAALHYGVAIPSINAAVDARIISGSRALRKTAQSYPRYKPPRHSRKKLSEHLRTALTLSILTTYFQGFHLLETATIEEHWNLDLAEIARIWQGGCIIRSRFLKLLGPLYTDDRKTPHKTAKKETLALFSPAALKKWHSLTATGLLAGIPLPAMTASLAYYDALTHRNLPQNLIQAQRDFFGAHTFERTDKPGTFHAEW